MIDLNMSGHTIMMNRMNKQAIQTNVPIHFNMPFRSGLIKLDITLIVSYSTMLNFSNVIIHFNIYVGILFLVAGIFGNIVNIIVFYKGSLQNPSTLILFCGSWASLLYILNGLLTRVIAGGFLIDWTTMSIEWCRARFYIGHVTLFVSISYMCYATIDQYFATSRKQTIRQLSNVKSARRAIAIILIFWLLHHLPIPILAQHVPTANGGRTCNTLINPYLRQYISYFTFPVLSAIIPIMLLTIVGSLTYRNVSILQTANIRQRAQRHLTSMILLQSIFIVVGSVPYGSYYVYSAITTNINKGPDRLAVENLIFQVVNVFYYFSHAFSFFVYLVSSKSFRDQVGTALHLPFRRNHVEPLQSVPMPLRSHHISNYSIGIPK